MFSFLIQMKSLLPKAMICSRLDWQEAKDKYAKRSASSVAMKFKMNLTSFFSWNENASVMGFTS